MKGFIVGIDLGGTNVRGALLDTNLMILKQLNKPTYSSKDKINTLEKIKDLIYCLINTPEVRKSKILGIGVGYPGFVDYKKGVVRYAANLAGWKNIPLKQIIEKEFHIPTYVDHDTRMATLGELIRGAGKGKKDFACIMVGTGIGMGLVTGGKIYREGEERSGNFGQMIVNKRLNKFDSIEKYSSGLALVRRARETISKGQGKGILNLVNGEYWTYRR